METFFRRNIFRFRVGDIDIADDLDKILNSQQNEGTIKTTQKEKILTFKKGEENIVITLDNNKFLIDKNPMIFLNENNIILFKVYSRTERNLSYILKLAGPKYEFYLPSNKKLSKEDLIKNRKILKVIVKLKNNEYKDIFEPLCTKLTKVGNFVKIKANYFLPESSQSLMIDHNSDFNLCINQRIDLINIMENFIHSDKYILKIYGSDGIGKSVSFLYLTTLESDYKFIYFNLRDINKSQLELYSYFKNAMMKYYSNFSNKFDNEELKKKDNYDFYLFDIKDMENQYGDQLKYGTFWNMLNYFCDFIENYEKSVIIIDQYKSEYGDIKIVKTLLSNYQKGGKIKFIISSSLNDYSVKEDFIIDLMAIYQKKIQYEIRLENIKNINQLDEEELENQIFNGFKVDENSEDINNIEDDFSRISEFNIETNVESEKTDKIIKKEEKNDSNEKEEIIIEKKRIEPDDIIYINTLISMEEIINKKDDELFKLFNYNPKTYTKYCYIYDSNKGKEFLHESFLQKRFDEIANKVKSFYDDLSINKYKDKSSENLKGTFLLKLNEIIKNKKELNLQELIQSLEVYPFKYLKIYVADSSPKNNIITLNKELINKKFILDYSYEFIEIAFSKIVDMISHVTLIDMNDLSG